MTITWLVATANPVIVPFAFEVDNQKKIDFFLDLSLIAQNAVV